MSIEMKLPELGENIESGDVLRVMVKPGDQVKNDQPVLELETDKATIEVPSSAEGVITEVRVKTGEKVTTGQVIFVVEEEQRAESKEPKAQAAATSGPQAIPPTPKAEVPVPPAPVTALAAEPSSIPAAPSARRLARELGVDIQHVHGSGPGGRISTDDVTAYARGLLAGASGSGHAARVGAPAGLQGLGTHRAEADERRPQNDRRQTDAGVEHGASRVPA